MSYRSLSSRAFNIEQISSQIGGPDDYAAIVLLIIPP